MVGWPAQYRLYERTFKAFSRVQNPILAVRCIEAVLWWTSGLGPDTAEHPFAMRPFIPSASKKIMRRAAAGNCMRTGISIAYK